MFTRRDEVYLVVELHRGESVLLPEEPGYPAYLVDPANPGVALQTQMFVFPCPQLGLSALVYGAGIWENCGSLNGPLVTNMQTYSTYFLTN